MANIVSKLQKQFIGKRQTDRLVIINDNEKGDQDAPGEFGFDDSERVNHGTHGEHSSEGRMFEGGMAHGKSRFEAIQDCIDRARKEAADPKVIVSMKPFKEDVKEIVKEAVQKAKELKAKKEQIKRYTTHPLFQQKDKETEFDIKPKSEDSAIYAKCVAYVRPQIAFIKKKLMRLVNDKSYARWLGGERRGKRVDRNVLHRIPCGERNLFKKKVESDIKDVCFSLVVDESGSMWGQKCEQSRYAAIMFSEILSAIRVPFEVIGYTTTGLSDKQRAEQTKYAHCSNHSYNRADNLQHNMYKRFDEKYEYAKVRLAQIGASGCNYDQDHMEFVWNRVKKREEKRKVIIWLSDGQPCGGEEARFKLKWMVNMIGLTEGCDIIGIGIQSDYVADFYHKHVIIDDVKQLGMNVVRLVEAAFTKRGGKKAKALTEEEIAASAKKGSNW